MFRYIWRKWATEEICDHFLFRRERVIPKRPIYNVIQYNKQMARKRNSFDSHVHAVSKIAITISQKRKSRDPFFSK